MRKRKKESEGLIFYKLFSNLSRRKMEGNKLWCLKFNIKMEAKCRKKIIIDWKTSEHVVKDLFFDEIFLISIIFFN